MKEDNTVTQIRGDISREIYICAGRGVFYSQFYFSLHCNFKQDFLIKLL